MEKAYNLNQAADLLGIKVRTIRVWVRTGKINAKQIPGTRRWIVLESEILRLQGKSEADENKS